MLYHKVQKLVSKRVGGLNLRSVRAVLKKNTRQLGHIKTVGKGRTKAAILEDLELWLDGQPAEYPEFVPKQDASTCYNSNYIVSANNGFGLTHTFLADEDQHFVDRIRTECKENGRFVDWGDVERRVKGFQRTMITDRNACIWSFVGYNTFWEDEEDTFV